MAEEAEIETKELQETIEELQEERKEREQEVQRSAWTRYIALTTAILAVFAAIGALQSGALINEAMMQQIRSSDKWNEYQAARQKDHLYSLQAYAILDRGVGSSALARSSAKARAKERPDARLEAAATIRAHHPASDPPAKAGAKDEWRALRPEARLRQYIGQAEKEREKETDLQREAQELERESRHETHAHHQFARSVALIQVAISLSAVAALTRMKSVWWLSLLVGVFGLGFFAAGMLLLK